MQKPTSTFKHLKNIQLYKFILFTLFIVFCLLKNNFAEASEKNGNQENEETSPEQLWNNLNNAIQQGDSITISKVNLKLGVYYFRVEHKFDSSKYYLLRSLDGMKQVNNVNGMVNSLKEITSLYIDFQKYNEAAKILEDNLQYAKDQNDKYLIKSIYYSIYWLYKTNSNYKKALDAHEQYFQYSESIRNLENVSKINQLQHDLYLKGNQNREALTKQNSFFSMLIIFLSAISLISIILTIYLIYKSKTKSPDDQKNVEIKPFLNVLDDFLLIVDKDGKILLNNEVLGNKLDYRTNELVGKHIESILNLNNLSFPYFVGEILNDTRIPQKHKILFSSNNEQVEVDVKISEGYWEKQEAYFIIFKDLTELKKSEEKFSKAFHSIASAMAISNLDDGVYIEVNESFCKLSGYSHSEVIGSSSAKLSLFVQEEDRKKIKEEVQNHGYIKDFVLTLLTKNGDLRFVNYSASIIQLQNKKHVIAVLLDITEKKQMEDKLYRKMTELSALLSSVPAMVYFKDSSLRYVTVNELFAKKTGFSVQDITGKTDYDLFTKEESDRFSETDKNVLENGIPIYNIEDIIKVKDGSIIYTLTSKIPFKNENGIVIGMVGSSIDISKIKDAEENLAKFSVELQRSNSELEQFAYIASHDLQEPLRKVQAFSDRLRVKYADKIDDAGRDYIDRMQSAANRMMDMINGLLDYSRITTKAKPFTLVNLNETIKQSMSDLEIAIDRTGAKINVSQLPTIYADGLQMGQLFTNLIGNAIKYQNKDNIPEIQIDATIESQHYCIYIKDNGIGFDEAYVERIFQPFQRLHGRSEYEGSGIGLAICQKIVQRHEGTINAKSQPGEGSTFIITFPIQQNEQ